MEFFDEGDAEIEATKAFIESVGEVESFCGEWRTSDNDFDSQAKKRKAARTQQRRKYRSGYTTELLHRKKAELEDLRSQVVVLEEWIDRLNTTRSTTKNFRGIGLTQVDDKSQQWARTALEEYHKRRQAEKVNRKLKSIQATQATISKKLLEALSAASAFDDQTFVFTSQRFVVSLKDDTLAVQQLSERANKLYLDTDSVFPVDLPLFGSRVQFTQHNELGGMIEMVGNTPLECTPKEAGKILWKEQKTASEARTRFLRYIKDIDAVTVAKGFDVTLRLPKFEVADVRGLQVVRTFESDGGRIVQIGACNLLLPSKGLQLCGHSWAVISNSTNDQQDNCHVEFYARIFVEAQDKISTQTEKLLHAWGLQMRAYWVAIQETILDEVAAQMIVATA